MQITKIVITGGPCAGKSSALRRIREVFSALGYTVLTIPETATELIGGGVAPWACGTRADYQRCQIRLQSEKEAVYEAAARTMPVERILIVCDRGVFDSKAYMGADRFRAALLALGKREEDVLHGYDAVFHLVSAAKGAEAYYTTENNSARTETVAEAAELDDRVLAVWSAHPYHRVIGNGADFDAKLDALIGEIGAFLETRQ